MSCGRRLAGGAEGLEASGRGAADVPKVSKSVKAVRAGSMMRPRSGLSEAQRLPWLGRLIEIVSIILILTAVTISDNTRFRARTHLAGYSPEIASVGSLPFDRPRISVRCVLVCPPVVGGRLDVPWVGQALALPL